MELIRQGSIVTVALSGDYGKPRPALVIQADYFDKLPSVTVCVISSAVRHDLERLRIIIEPTPQNGLRQTSQIAVDKTMTIPRAKIGGVIGMTDADIMEKVKRAMALFIGFG